MAYNKLYDYDIKVTNNGLQDNVSYYDANIEIDAEIKKRFKDIELFMEFVKKYLLEEAEKIPDLYTYPYKAKHELKENIEDEEEIL